MPSVVKVNASGCKVKCLRVRGRCLWLCLLSVVRLVVGANAFECVNFGAWCRQMPLVVRENAAFECV